MTDFLNTYAISFLGIVSLTVLTAIGKVAADVSVPLIVGLAGLHTGAAVTLNGKRGKPNE